MQTNSRTLKKKKLKFLERTFFFNQYVKSLGVFTPILTKCRTNLSEFTGHITGPDRGNLPGQNREELN